jgi:hypothetical protein
VEGRLGARVMRNWSRNSTYPEGAYLLQTTEWVLLRIDGAVVHPNLFRFGAALQPQWAQSGGTKGDQSGFRSLAWSADATFLHNGRPYWMTFTAGQSETVRRDRTGFGDERWLTRYVGELHMLLPGLPTRLQYRYDGESAAFDGAGPTGFSSHSLRLNAENSKTRVLLERLWLPSTQGPAIGQWIGNLAHRHRWGSGSIWSSQLGYLRYDGPGGRTRWSWSEAGRIRHTNRLTSNLSLRYLTTRSDVTLNSIWTTGFGLSYPIGSGLKGSTSFGSQWTRRPIDRERRLTLTQSVGFLYRLPGRIRINGGGSVAFVGVRSEVGGDGLAEIVGEEQVVGLDGSFLLENPGVDPASIRVSSVDRGLLYQVGLDFDVLASGPFTLIALTPASRIAVGDTVSVDYAYALPPLAPSDQLAASAEAHLLAGPVDAFVRLRRTVPLSDVPEGSIGNFYLSDLNETELGIRVGGRLLSGQARAAATRLLRQSGDFDYALTSMHGSFSMRLPARMSINVGGGASWSGRAANQARTLSVSGGVSWAARRFLSAWASGGAWTVSQSSTDLTRSHIGGRLGASFRIARVSIEADYQVRTWEDGLRRTEDRFSVRVERTF